MLEVDHKQHNHRACKQQALNKKRGRIKEQIRAEKYQASDQFDDRVLNGNRRSTISTSPAQPHVRGDWNVVVRLYGSIAVRAVRAGPHERLPQRQPINTNVQKAANRGTEY